MMIFEGDVLDQTIAVAHKYNVEPAALLAVVEVESAGKSLESDGTTPCLLFERHIFYRELKKAGLVIALDKAVKLGLALPSWQPSTQYKDQGTSAKRLELFQRAKAIDPECAARSCSWGVGQTMGFLAQEVRFPNATSMLAYMEHGGVPAQIDCMIREIQNKNLLPKLKEHNWEGFAKVYNGPGYAKNNYDVKLAGAYLKWSRAVLPDVVVPPQLVQVPFELQPGPTPVPATVSAKQFGFATSGAAVATSVWANMYPTRGALFVAAAVTVMAIGAIAVVWRQAQVAKQAPERGMLPETRGEDIS